MQDAKRRVTAAIAAHPGASPAEIAQALDVSDRTISRYLARLRAEGAIAGTTKRLYLPLADERGRYAPRAVAAPQPRPGSGARRPPTSRADGAVPSRPVRPSVGARLELGANAPAARATSAQPEVPDDLPPHEPRARGFVGTLLELADVDAAHTTTRGEPAALPLAGDGLELRLIAARHVSPAPVRASRPTSYRLDEFGRPHVMRPT